MANFLPVPDQNITSVDITSFRDGLSLNGAQNGSLNCFIDSKNVELTIDGFLTQRRVLIPFLPDTTGEVYQILPVLWNGTLYYFTADNNQMVYCKEGDPSWTACTGANSIHTGLGGKPEFVRVLDNVVMMNGKNGDKLCYADLSTTGFPVVKYSLVTDPTVAPTATLTNLSAGAYNIYAAYSYTNEVGETKLSPILTQSINIVRDQWGNSTTTPGSIKFSRPAGAAPAGSQYWNFYIALAATSGSIQPSDMLRVATKLDLNTHDFVDDGTLSIDLGSIAPIANSTDGPRVNHGIVEDGNPIYFDDEDDPENIWIGGGGPYAMSLSVSNGGYKAQPEQGTNFRPTAVIGFRNGQGIPSLTVLFSNTEGLAKQSVLEQQTVNYGDQSFTVWGVTEQHYGAAGVAATNSAVNYNGKLLFLSTDGFMSMNTQPLRQNVISTDNISIKQIDSLVRTIKNSAMDTVVGTGWDNKFMWTVPTNGFDLPQQILIEDDNNGGAWYTMDIPAQWIGVVSPQDAPAFVYVVQGKRSFKLVPGSGTYDTIDGVSVPFSTGATGSLVGFGGNARNTWQSDVQTMFYVMGLVGEMTIGVTYRDQDGKMQTKTKDIKGADFQPSAAGGWGDPNWSYAGLPQVPGLRSAPPMDPTVAGAVNAMDVREAIETDDIMSEAQWFFYTPIGYNSFKAIRAISFEGINLGVRPDLQ